MPCLWCPVATRLRLLLSLLRRGDPRLGREGVDSAVGVGLLLPQLDGDGVGGLVGNDLLDVLDTGLAKRNNRDSPMGAATADKPERVLGRSREAPDDVPASQRHTCSASTPGGGSGQACGCCCRGSSSARGTNRGSECSRRRCCSTMSDSMLPN